MWNENFTKKKSFCSLPCRHGLLVWVVFPLLDIHALNIVQLFSLFYVSLLYLCHKLPNLNFMGKKDFLNVILRDIKELGLITEGMKEMDKVPTVMQDLAMAKVQNIFDALKSINDTDSNVTEVQLERTTSVVEKNMVERQETKIYEGNVSVEPESKVQPVEPEISVHNVEPEPETVGRMAEEQKAIEPQMPKTEPKETTQPKPDLHQPAQSEVKSSQKNASASSKQTTNDKFNVGVRLVNDTVSSASKKVEGKFIKSIRKSLNLNDTFRYRKALFGGNQELMTQTIDALDSMSTLAQAKSYMAENFDWREADAEAVADFTSLVEARFSN